MLQITYQKNDGTIFKRIRNTALPYKIGDMTSMGWIVLNIEYNFKGNYYPESKYNMLISKDKKFYLKKKERIEKWNDEFKRFMYCFITLLILKLILGI